ncbi:hypothetical protein Taro_013027 [Colocasia esculenta]|uniref:Uncharacterized protein n=1 Tax=Colocasia esculenta TaxID=4460 RepID=A0A843U5K4_COLES|nr:hypothetical protein [Colocasia esculenta]
MKYGSLNSAASREQRNPLPRRGQIKAKIFGSLLRSVVRIGSKKRGNERKGPDDGGQSAASGSPAVKEMKWLEERETIKLRPVKRLTLSKKSSPTSTAQTPTKLLRRRCASGCCRALWAMAYEGPDNPRKGKRDQLPRRGQVKVMVFGVVVRSLLTLGSKKGREGGEGREQRHGEDLVSSTRPSPTGRQGSEAPGYGAAGSPPSPFGNFLGSTKSLNAFVVEAPSAQVL